MIVQHFPALQAIIDRVVNSRTISIVLVLAAVTRLVKSTM